MVKLPGFYPWQRDVALRWLGAEERARFAHAWLIHGLAGIGKVDFARAAAAALLCEAPHDGMACGRCPACIWYAAGNHPDFRRIRPEAVALAEGEEEQPEEGAEEPAGARGRKAPSRDIRIEQIRAMESWITTGTHRGGLRVVLLYPAETLNTVSANALLKVLEEPPPHTVFLLVADAPDRLPATLVSRCRRLPLGAPDPAQARSWLQVQGVADADAQLAAAGGAPVAAWRRAQSGLPPRPEWIDTLVQAAAAGRAPDVGALVDLLDKAEPADWIDKLQRLCVDLALLQAGLPARYFAALADPLARVAQRAARRRVAEAARWLGTQRAIADHPLNGKLFAQEALARVCAACAPAAAPRPA
ncbi:DNA polymerase III subunit delta' [Pigmentiphaga soli]|uniref:DNA polymerase III subunit delta n=1 Tax=Pigmentiphaga soli TaxID=1007095 RepID=A0ABP8H825_9BURK